MGIKSILGTISLVLLLISSALVLYLLVSIPDLEKQKLDNYIVYMLKSGDDVSAVRLLLEFDDSLVSTPHVRDLIEGSKLGRFVFHDEKLNIVFPKVLEDCY